MSCAERGRTAGFTLIEVLVALALVGFAMAAIAGVLGGGLIAHETAGDAETALAVAEQRLALAAAGPSFRAGAAKGEFAGRFAWQTTTEPYRETRGTTGSGDAAAGAPDPAGLPQLFRIAVSVAWRDGHRNRELALSTLRLGPPTPP